MATKTPEMVAKVTNNFFQFIRRNSRREGVFASTALRSSPPDGEAIDYWKQSFLRRFPTNLIINLDETPLPFEFLSGYSYDFKGASTVADKSERSGWDKRQATIILFIMADDSTLFKPVIIFHGKGTVVKRETYDARVQVEFNETAYNNEGLFQQRLKEVYQPYIADHAYGDQESLIVMDAASVGM
jgi:hypothetical protein